MDLFWQLIQYLISVVQAVINLSPETINQYADDLGPWLYVVLFADHLCRDGAGGHAVSAGRLAVIRRRRRRGPSGFSDPARH